MKGLKVFKRFPVLVQSLQAGSLMAGGDIFSQLGIEKKKIEDFEFIRTARFFGIGFVIVAPALRVWYGFLDKKFGSVTKVGVLKKVTVDQLVFAPSFLFVFLSVLGVTQNKSINEIQSQIKRDYKDIILTNWTVWPAVQIVNFSFVPLQHQVLAVQFVALLWNTYLAWKTNRLADDVKNKDIDMSS